MRTIPLLRIPNQSLSITVDDARWDIALKSTSTSLIVDLSLDDEIIVLGLRVIPNQPLIPYKYLSTTGNFILLTQNDELPEWGRLGEDQKLVYASCNEIESYD